MLLLNSHDSHISAEFISYCIQKNIIALCLPTHSIHRLQPLDVGFNAVYSKQYSNTADNALRNNITGIDKQLFIKLLTEARENTVSEDLIKAAWREAGLVPYNPEKVLSKLQYNEAAQTEILNSVTETPARPQAVHKAVIEILTRSGHLLSSPTINSIHQLGRATERAISETIILQEANTQLRAANKKASQIRRGKPRLTGARVLNDQEISELWQNKAIELDARGAEPNSMEPRKGRGRPRGSGSGRGRGRGRGCGRGRGGTGRPRGRPRKGAGEDAGEGSAEDSAEDSAEGNAEDNIEDSTEDNNYVEE
ncbi:uncharacterized protein DFL_006528 [Arthrobotrys flagrans]|uniref:DDE-1 domain-containing protein n=1 Tax=Arthrobotrys flagrans TaxID=97331 RepID=A0A436ZTC8_ARTFL|nr:hypothetical protein DFL_006528 [Arthrobotrys flagrans]